MYVVYIENPQNRAQRNAVVNTITDCLLLRIKKPLVPTKRRILNSGYLSSGHLYLRE